MPPNMAPNGLGAGVSNQQPPFGNQGGSQGGNQGGGSPLGNLGANGFPGLGNMGGSAATSRARVAAAAALSPPRTT